MRLLSRLTATAAVVGALTIAPHASADLSQGFSNADGTVNCESANIEGTYVACLSECSPRFIHGPGVSRPRVTPISSSTARILALYRENPSFAVYGI